LAGHAQPVHDAEQKRSQASWVSDRKHRGQSERNNRCHGYRTLNDETIKLTRSRIISGRRWSNQPSHCTVAHQTIRYCILALDADINETMLAKTLESLTDLHEIVAAVVRRALITNAMADGLKTHMRLPPGLLPSWWSRRGTGNNGNRGWTGSPY
jgi:hypothetical protein